MAADTNPERMRALAPLSSRIAAGERYACRTLDRLRIADDNLREVLKGRRHLLFDGGMGTMLQAAGLAAGASPELLNLSDPEAIERIHRAYVEAGCDVVTTNTFGASSLKLGGTASVDEVFFAAARAARASGARYVAGDIGPLGALLHPLGTLSFDEAYAYFAEEVRAAAAAEVDLIVIETMTDLGEMKAAILAAKENCDLPIFATMTFESDGRTFLGTSPEVAAATLDALGADVLGINCSLGPIEIRPFAQRMLAVTAKPIMVQANAGLPRVEDGCTVYDITPDDYGQAVAKMVADGVAVIGGCCGTTPAYIERLARFLDGHAPKPRPRPDRFVAASAQKLVALDERAIAVIGERINPTGKKRLQEALRAGDIAYVVGQGITQQEQGADILDVNVGLPGIDEAAMMLKVVEELEAATVLPLQIDSTNPVAIEAAVRRYPGIPLINSVNGERSSMDAILPIAAHYGCGIVALTLDEQGIPEAADERVSIARRIIDEACALGIDRNRILVDTLVMTASTNQHQVLEILDAVRRCRSELHVRCSLGVSNVSFGLPARGLLNATFLAAAFGAGLSAAIINPASARYMDTVRSFRVLNAEDEGSAAFIERYATAPDPYRIAAGGAAISTQTALEGAPSCPEPQAQRRSASAGPNADADLEAIRHLIVSGRKGDMPQATASALASHDPLSLINECLVPALDDAGERFDRGEFFLPQLMASAEAARTGFDAIRAALPAGDIESKGGVCLATVKGDIHDIGKNIVKMLLENYGYTVFDLGRDVDPHDILAAVRERGIRLVGLSALMTTTVPSMEETIALIHREAPDVKVVVGGAVLTPDYARTIGADYYAKDAAEAVRIVEEVLLD
ncbi:homocysteine S-methyltransferase family protein [Enorma phocaeensis]|uniref:homocysteine S-methyltransferase family protein n=1 Tax=Enorma phocaeensis TaxID=1871019 RepID=UPI00320AD025